VSEMKFGLNMGALTADFEKDPAAVLKELAVIGYRGIEVTRPLPLPVPEFNRLAKELDLVPLSLHVGAPANDEEMNADIDFVRSVNCERIVFGGFHPKDLNSADDYKRQAEAFNKNGKITKQSGVRTHYHNHHWEFKKFGGRYGLDIMMEETDPELVSFEIDVCWAAVGGADPARYIHEHEKRCRLIHYKDIHIREGYDLDGHAPGGIIEADGYSLKENSYGFAEAGTGIVDFGKIRSVINPDYVEWLISEQDNSDLPPMETARINYNNYKRMGVM